MDAFAVSICQGLIEKKNFVKNLIKISFTFGFFQFFMTFLGGKIGDILIPFLHPYKTLIPCFIFCGIAILMLKEGWEQRRISCDSSPALNKNKTLFLLAVATSMDALFIGITFSMKKNFPLVLTSFLIGCTTFTISAFGYYFGKLFSFLGRHKAYYIGSFLLFCLGIYSILEHITR